MASIKGSCLLSTSTMRKLDIFLLYVPMVKITKIVKKTLRRKTKFSFVTSKGIFQRARKPCIKEEDITNSEDDNEYVSDAEKCETLFMSIGSTADNQSNDKKMFQMMLKKKR